ncbi:hypothetical protein D3C85_1484410 [compost metagenome]
MTAPDFAVALALEALSFSRPVEPEPHDTFVGVEVFAVAAAEVLAVRVVEKKPVRDESALAMKFELVPAVTSAAPLRPESAAEVLMPSALPFTVPLTWFAVE